VADFAINGPSGVFKGLNQCWSVDGGHNFNDWGRANIKISWLISLTDSFHDPHAVANGLAVAAPVPLYLPVHNSGAARLSL
jgi:hypothetical protein